MPVIYKENKIITFIRNFSNKTLFFISFLILFSISAFWFLLFYCPVLYQINNDLIDIKNFTLEQEHYKKAVKEYFLFEQAKKNLSEDLRILLKENNARQDNLTLAMDALKNFNLTCKEFTPVNIKNELDFDEEYFTIRAKGLFKNFVSYFNFLHDSKILLNFKTVDFQLGKNQEVKLLGEVSFINIKNNELNP